MRRVGLDMFRSFAVCDLLFRVNPSVLIITCLLSCVIVLMIGFISLLNVFRVFAFMGVFFWEELS